jgi:hypothetical protein
MSDARDRRVRIGFGAANLFTAVLVYAGVFRGLPTRWAPVDVGAVVVIALSAASGLALLADRRGAVALARVSSIVVLALGMIVFAALVLTASWLAGVYGPVGRGGALVFFLVAAMVLPYAIVVPAAELLWLGPPQRR